MAGSVGVQRGPIASINVTPFVDVVLVLLVILMVSVKAANEYVSSFEVDLPSAAAGGEAVESSLNLIIKADGNFEIDGVLANEASLAQYARAQSRANPKVQAVIGADRNVSYDRVVRAIDVIKQNGVTTFALSLKQAGPVDPSGE